MGGLKKYICLSLLFLATSLVCADDNLDAMKRQLTLINQHIDDVQSTLSDKEIQQKTLEKSLKTMEISIGELSRTLHQLDKQISLENTQLKLLQAQQAIYQHELSTQQVALSTEIRAAYLMGQQNYLKLLLNQKDVDTLTRNLTYFKYLNAQRMNLITRLNATLSALTTTQQKITTQTSTLSALREQQRLQKTQLLRGQTTRQALLAKLKQDIQTNTDVLNALQNNKHNLSDLMRTLEKKAAQSVFQTPPIALSQLKGKLPWPTQGPLALHFNTPLYQSDLLSTGVVITAPEGQNVYAVYGGKVMFSAWLKGFGLLMIIDHGNGYMSLYGRNQSLFKKAGQNVDAGELIAQVGETGGYSQSGLYFEIRHGTEPEDPEAWCTSP